MEWFANGEFATNDNFTYINFMLDFFDFQNKKV